MRGESSDAEQDDPDSKFGPMQRGDFVKNFVPSVRAEPSLLRAEQARLGLGQDIHERAGFSGPRLYVENIVVRNIQLAAA
jgi:hypothetical protein